MITTLNLTPQLQFRTLLFSFSFTLDMIRLPLSILPSRVGVTTQESLANFVAISLQHSQRSSVWIRHFFFSPPSRKTPKILK